MFGRSARPGAAINARHHNATYHSLHALILLNFDIYDFQDITTLKPSFVFLKQLDIPVCRKVLHVSLQYLSSCSSNTQVKEKRQAMEYSRVQKH
jgi:hypothetical protein